MSQGAHNWIDNLKHGLVGQTDDDPKKIIETGRWGLLTSRTNHTQPLLKLKEIKKPLYVAYLFKDEFDDVCDRIAEQSGINVIENWLKKISDDITRYFQSCYEMPIRYLDGVVSYLVYRDTNPVVEGRNNKIKALKRRAYGYRSEEYFKSKIWRRCGYLKFPTPVLVAY